MKSLLRARSGYQKKTLRHLPKNSFVKTILLVAFISVFLLAAYDVFYVFPSFRELLLTNSEGAALHIASHLREDLLSANVRLERGRLPDVIGKTAERTKRDLGLWKIIFFSPSGEIVYSTDPADLGHRIDKKFFNEIVAKGGTYKKYVPKNGLTPAGQVATADVVSAYVPVMKDGRFAGATEVYMDISGVITRSRRVFLTSFLTLFSIVSSLLLSLIVVAGKARKSAVAREKAEEALEENERFLRTIIETEPECVKVVAADSTLLMMNPAGLAMIDADSFEQVKGKRICALVLPEYREAFDNLTRDVFRGKSGILDFEIVGFKGKRLWLSTHAVPLFEKNGEVAALLGITRDVTQEKRSTEALETSLREKEILLRELYHRTKNNLQVISSLISLQSTYTKDDLIMNALADTCNRIRAMSLVHEKLYKTKDLSRTNVKDYVEDLAHAILSSYEERAAAIALVFDIDSAFLAIDTITPFGLIINELMTNSLKYAFPDGKAGEIRMSFRNIDEDQMEFVFSDDGVGLPSTDIKNMKSLGLKLVNNLATKQLGGTLVVRTGKGTEFRLAFKG